MYGLISLGLFMIFVVGVLVGVRCQEINLQGRERRLAQERRSVNNQLHALMEYQESAYPYLSGARRATPRHDG